MHVIKFHNMKSIKDRTPLAKNLIRLRKEKGLSQKELSELSGISRRMIVYYETKPINPPLDKLEILANALNATINDLVGEKGLTKKEGVFTNLDTRTIKKLEQLLSLSQNERHFVYKLIDKLISEKVEK